MALKFLAQKLNNWHGNCCLYIMQCVSKFLNLKGNVTLFICGTLLGVPVAGHTEVLQKVSFVGSIEESTTAANMLTNELLKINQPRLIQQQARVQYFRNMFAKHKQHEVSVLAKGKPSLNVQKISQDMPTQVNEQNIVSTSANDEPSLNVQKISQDMPTQVNEQNEAIEQLQNRLLARKRPNLLMPLSSITTAFYFISNGVNKLMISNLESGHLPIYEDGGRVVGTRDAASGKLTAGQDRRIKNGTRWKSPG